MKVEIKKVPATHTISLELHGYEIIVLRDELKALLEKNDDSGFDTRVYTELVDQLEENVDAVCLEYTTRKP